MVRRVVHVGEVVGAGVEDPHVRLQAETIIVRIRRESRRQRIGARAMIVATADGGEAAQRQTGGDDQQRARLARPRHSLLRIRSIHAPLQQQRARQPRTPDQSGACAVARG